MQYFVLSSSTKMDGKTVDLEKYEQIIDLPSKTQGHTVVLLPTVSVYPTMTTRLCKDCREEKDHRPFREWMRCLFGTFLCSEILKY